MAFGIVGTDFIDSRFMARALLFSHSEENSV